MAMADPASKPLSIWQILKEALKTTTKNWGVFLPLLLLSFLSSAASYFATISTTTPLVTTLTTKAIALFSAQRFSPEFYNLLSAIRSLLRELIGLKIVLNAVSFVLSSLMTNIVTTVFFLAMTYSGKHVSLSDLFSRIKSSSKGPMITLAYIFVFNKLLSSFFVLSTLVLVFIFSDSPVLMVLGIVVFLLEFVIFLYVDAVLLLSAVVSVMDTACYGVAAIAKGMELIRGKRWQVLRINLIALVGAVPCGLLIAHPRISPVALGLVSIGMSVVFSVFILAANTVFYYECRKSHGEEEISSTDVQFAYINV